MVHFCVQKQFSKCPGAEMYRGLAHLLYPIRVCGSPRVFRGAFCDAL